MTECLHILLQFSLLQWNLYNENFESHESLFIYIVTTVPLAVGYGALNLSVRSLDR